MLRKASSWVSSPFAVSLLLGACGSTGPTVDKYTQINQHDGETVDFKNSFPIDTALVLTNIHRFKDSWKSDSKGSPCMKVYNSFNYTQDVKYETRLLELPTSGDYKLIILVPNETDVLPDLFSKLRNEGLEATASCLQPMFTTTTRLEAPSISISSKIINEQEILTKSLLATGLHYGKVKVNDEGIYISVLTCLYSTSIKKEKEDLSSEEQTSFCFAVVFKDTPIFIGQYYPYYNITDP